MELNNYTGFVYNNFSLSLYWNVIT